MFSGRGVGVGWLGPGGLSTAQHRKSQHSKPALALVCPALGCAGECWRWRCAALGKRWRWLRWRWAALALALAALALALAALALELGPAALGSVQSVSSLVSDQGHNSQSVVSGHRETSRRAPKVECFTGSPIGLAVKHFRPRSDGETWDGGETFRGMFHRGPCAKNVSP